MAPCNGTTPSPHHSTLQWHPAMAPSNGTTSAPPKLVVALPSPHHCTLQWHPAMAPSNGTTSAPPKLVVTLPLNHSTLQWHPTMAPSNGTTSTAPCNGTLVPRPIRQSGSSPSPLLEVRTPIAIAIWGKIWGSVLCGSISLHFIHASPRVFFPKQFTVGVLNATLDLAALVLVGVAEFLGSDVVSAPFGSLHLGLGVGWGGCLLGWSWLPLCGLGCWLVWLPSLGSQVVLAPLGSLYLGVFTGVNCLGSTLV